MRFTHADEVFTYFESFANLARLTHYTNRAYRLDRMQALNDHFNYPDRAFSSIHLAGSKGKGSTATFIRSALSASGCRTGLYLSPHVADYRERYTVDGEFIQDDILVETANSMVSHLEGFSFPDEQGYEKPTTFELLTLYAFLLFKAVGCLWVVVETGLGGRLDATNVISPELTVITPIELEHTAVLGDTVEQIAREKGGIIKQGIPLVLGYQSASAAAVLRGIAAERSAEVVSLEESVTALTSHTEHAGEQCSIDWGDSTTCLLLRMRGSFQCENAALALVCMQTLGFEINERVLAAVADSVLPGRMEMISDNPRIYVDGAHTERSISKLFASFRQLYPDDGILIFGAVEGKDHVSMARHALRNFGRIIISTPGYFKKSDPRSLYELFVKLDADAGGACRISFEPEPARAVELAMKEISASGESSAERAIITAGSFYMAAEIRAAYSRLKTAGSPPRQ